MVDPKQVTPPEPDYQDRDVDTKAIVLFIAGLGVFTLILAGGLAAFFLIMDRQQDRAEADFPPEVYERVLPPGPRLIVDEKEELEEYLENARMVLNNYSVQDDGTVRIPVEKAMELVAERGLPTWEAPEPDEPPATADPLVDEIQDESGGTYP